MDRQNIRDSKLIERYLEGELLDEAELSPEQRAALAKLEEAYLEDVELLDELMMRKALKDLDANGELGAYTSPPKVADFAAHKTKRGWLSMLHSPQYAVAASIAFAVSLVVSGLLYVDNRSLRDTVLAFDAPTAGTIRLFATRGAESAVQVAPPGADGLTILLVDAGFDQFDDYRALIVRVAGTSRTTIYERAGLELGAYEAVPVAVANRLLEPGQYEVELSGRMDDWAADRGFELITRMQFMVLPPQ
jgi:hypothetical protein